jgi:hypothetical protein
MTTQQLSSSHGSTTSAKPRRPRKRHVWRETICEAFYCADHAWWLLREEVALGYATEMREFAEQHPRPQLKWFMIHLSHGWRREEPIEIKLEHQDHDQLVEQRWAA